MHEASQEIYCIQSFYFSSYGSDYATCLSLLIWQIPYTVFYHVTFCSADVEKLKRLILHNPYILTLPEVGDLKDDIIPKNVQQFYVRNFLPAVVNLVNIFLVAVLPLQMKTSITTLAKKTAILLFLQFLYFVYSVKLHYRSPMEYLRHTQHALFKI